MLTHLHVVLKPWQCFNNYSYVWRFCVIVIYLSEALSSALCFLRAALISCSLLARALQGGSETHVVIIIMALYWVQILFKVIIVFPACLLRVFQQLLVRNWWWSAAFHWLKHKYPEQLVVAPKNWLAVMVGTTKIYVSHTTWQQSGRPLSRLNEDLHCT